jgi:hypothetical protein
MWWQSHSKLQIGTLIMSVKAELAGQRFGRWTAVSYVGNRKWLCRCDCGTEKEVFTGSLTHGKSAGCIKCHPALGNQKTHGAKHTRLYNIWSGMKRRCENPLEPAYPRYGGRGISVCPEWRDDFVTFQSWSLANGYRANFTIDRESNDGNYDAGNCRWATYREQGRNRRNNIIVKWHGADVLLLDLAEAEGVSYDMLKQRVRRYGWSIERAVSEPSKQTSALTFTVTHGNIDAVQP